MIADEIHYLTVRELGERIKSGKLSPVAITEAYLDRSARIGKRLNAYVTLMPESALAEARAAEAEIKAGKYRGPLHGIPYAAKDLLAVRGQPTTWGAKAYGKQQFDYDAAVVEKLRAAGAVLLGKAATIALAGGFGYRFAAAALTGPCKTPWTEKHWAGGSSSGSGAIASAGLAAFALGTETWGSVVCPATFCGVSGLRPTFGRVSRFGCMSLSPTMDKIGVLARSAGDCGVVLAHLAGYDPRDAYTLPDGDFRGPQVAQDVQLRIGWCINAFPKKVPAAIETAVKKAVDTLGANNAIIAETALPTGPWDEAAGTIISVEGAAEFTTFLDSGRAALLEDPLEQIGGYAGQLIPASDYLRAQQIRAKLQRTIDLLFDRYDVLAAPTFPCPAPPLDANLEEALDYPDPLGAIGNMCGLPAISVPCGLTDEKLPLGLLFVGRALDEHKVLAAARRFQERTDWHTLRPPVG